MRRSLHAGFITFVLILCSTSTALADPAHDYAGSRMPRSALESPSGDSVFSADSNRVKGMVGPDVSHWQGCSIDWNAVATKRKYAFMKATEGTYYRDDCFVHNWLGAKAAGLLRGAYDFANPLPSAQSARAEADFYIHRVKQYGGFRNALPPVLDIEVNDHGMSQQQLRRWIRAWIDQVRKHTHRTTVTIYTGDWWWAPNVGAWKPKGALLWASRYPIHASEEARVTGWGRPNWWQYTDGKNGPNPQSTPGIGHSDHSTWLGKKSALYETARNP
jgi:GH25 family lysozyme M1 (1,4-beta-N-acetylmuramidase)